MISSFILMLLWTLTGILEIVEEGSDYRTEEAITACYSNASARLAKHIWPRPSTFGGRDFTKQSKRGRRQRPAGWGITSGAIDSRRGHGSRSCVELRSRLGWFSSKTVLFSRKHFHFEVSVHSCVKALKLSAFILKCSGLLFVDFWKAHCTSRRYLLSKIPMAWE